MNRNREQTSAEHGNEILRFSGVGLVLVAVFVWLESLVPPPEFTRTSCSEAGGVRFERSPGVTACWRADGTRIFAAVTDDGSERPEGNDAR